MVRFITLIGSLLVATQVSAQDQTYDSVDVEAEGYSAVVTYYNTDNSMLFRKTYEVNGIEFSVNIDVDTGGPEVLTVETTTEGYQVVPQERREVEDGTAVTVYIVPVTG